MIDAAAMPNSTLSRGALPALLAASLAAGCGGSSSSADTYNGVVDPSVFDSKFLPITSSSATALKSLCTSGDQPVSTPCYPVQTGYAHGKKVRFFNVVFGGTAVRTSPTSGNPMFAPCIDSNKNPVTCQLAASVQTAVYNFPNSCAQGPAYNPQTDAYIESVQYPIFAQLPLATTTFGVTIFPLVQLFPVTVSGNTCNDLKSAGSIAASGAQGGLYGAQAAAASSGLNLWAMVDPSANFQSLSGPGGGPPPLGSSWYLGLQGFYLDGGKVPVDSSGIALAMDGVILNGSTFANAYDNQAVILPAMPGEDAYSPVVRLRQFALPTGKKLGDFTDLCPLGSTSCAANQVDMSKTTSSFNTIFIVAQPQ
jgi:hypothetical protein